nr:hypothetical protein [Tanacetum cinerariifolium]
MNYLEEQTDDEAMINSIQNGDHPFPVITQVSLARTTSNVPPPQKDKSMWTVEEKKNRKINRLARSLLIQGIPNDIYSLIDNNNSAKELWVVLERHMLGSEYGEQDRKAAVLYEYETFRATEGEMLLDTYIRYLQVINDLKKCGYKKDNYELNFKSISVGCEENKVTKCREKVVVQSESEGSDDEDLRDLKKITALLAKAFNQKTKKEDKKVDEKKQNVSKVKCYNFKKEGHFAKDCKKAKVKDYSYYKTKMLLAKKDSDEQVIFAKNQAWMESSSNLDQEMNANMVFMTKMEKFFQIQRRVHHPQKKPLLSISKLNKDVKRYSRKDLLSCDNSHHVDTRSSYTCNDAMNLSCNSRLYASYDVNDLFVFDDVSIRKSQVSKMPFRKKPRDCLNVRSKSNSNKSLPRTVFWWLPKMQPLAEPVAKWIPKIVQIFLWIIDSGCSKHMTSNRALLTNFVKKFLGTDHFGNNDFAVIAGYRDVVIGSMTIKKVYYAEDGVDLFTGDHSSKLYTIALNEVTSNSSACLLAKASSLQSWLWHQCLSHLKFTTINNLLKNNLVRVQHVRTDNGTEFKNKTLAKFFHEDIGVFVGYSKESAAFRVYNKRTRKIHERVNMNFDEISEMASKQFSLEPGLSNLSETGKSSNPTVSQVSEISKKDLEDLFYNCYDEYFDSSKLTKSPTTNVKTSNNEIPSHEGEVFHEVYESFQEESSSSSLNDDV